MARKTICCVPAAPLAVWVQRQLAIRAGLHNLIGAPIAEQVLAKRMDIALRTLKRWRDQLDGNDRPTESYQRTKVERALHYGGWSLRDVYSEEELAEIEAEDAETTYHFCERCNETTAHVIYNDPARYRVHCCWCLTSRVLKQPGRSRAKESAT